MEKKDDIQLDRDLSQPEAKLKMVKKKKAPNSKDSKDSNERELQKQKNMEGQVTENNNNNVVSEKKSDKSITSSPKVVQMTPRKNKDNNSNQEQKKSNKENADDTDLYQKKEENSPNDKRELKDPLEQNEVTQQDPNISNLHTPDQTMSYVDNTNREVSQQNIKEEFYLREIEYKAKIKELEQELNEEKNKSTVKQKISSEETLNNLRKELQEKDNEINKYIFLNTKQRQELENLSKEIDKKLKFMNFKHVTDRIKKERRPIKETTPEDSIKIVETQLRNALKLVDVLTKDNQQLKEKCNSAMDSKSKYDLIDKSKEHDSTIISLKLEIKKLKRQVGEHLKCQKNKEDYEKSIRLAKDDLRKAQLKNEEMKTKIKEEEENYNKNLNSPKEKPKSIGKNKAATRRISLKKRGPNEEKHNNMNNQRSEASMQNGLNVFTKDEQEALLQAFDNNNTQFELFIKKVATYDSYRQSLESRHKFNVKNYLTKLNEMDEQIDYLKSNNADKEAKNKLLNTQMDDYKGDKAAYTRKIKEMQNEISAMQTIHKQKDSEIKSLIVQLNTLRQLLKNANVNQIDEEISNYINSIKKENYDLEPSEDEETKPYKIKEVEDNTKQVNEMVDLGIQKTTNENKETQNNKEEPDPQKIINNNCNKESLDKPSIKGETKTNNETPNSKEETDPKPNNENQNNKEEIEQKPNNETQNSKEEADSPQVNNNTNKENLENPSIKKEAN